MVAKDWFSTFALFTRNCYVFTLTLFFGIDLSTGSCSSGSSVPTSPAVFFIVAPAITVQPTNQSAPMGPSAFLLHMPVEHLAPLYCSNGQRMAQSMQPRWS